MGSELANLYPINERDLHVFAAVAGQWLKTHKPAVVRKTYDILRDCGISASMNSVKLSIKKLVNAEWLKPRPYGEKLHRYVPTLQGFSEFATAWEAVSTDKLMTAFTLPDTSSLMQYYDTLDTMKCLERRVPVTKVLEVGRALATLVDVAALQDIDLSPKYAELARAVEEARPVDEVDFTLVEQLVDKLPAMQCILLDAKANDVISELLAAITHACRRGLAEVWGSALQKVVEGYLALAQYCSHLGVQFDTKPNENLLRNLANITRCGNT